MAVGGRRPALPANPRAVRIHCTSAVAAGIRRPSSSRHAIVEYGRDSCEESSYDAPLPQSPSLAKISPRALCTLDRLGESVVRRKNWITNSTVTLLHCSLELFNGITVCAIVIVGDHIYS